LDHLLSISALSENRICASGKRLDHYTVVYRPVVCTGDTGTDLGYGLMRRYITV
jgi:hypothetical protein